MRKLRRCLVLLGLAGLVAVASLPFKWMLPLPGGASIRNRPPFFHPYAGRVLGWKLSYNAAGTPGDEFCVSVRWHKGWLPCPHFWGCVWSDDNNDGCFVGEIWEFPETKP